MSKDSKKITSAKSLKGSSPKFTISKNVKDVEELSPCMKEKIEQAKRDIRMKGFPK